MLNELQPIHDYLVACGFSARDQGDHLLVVRAATLVDDHHASGLVRVEVREGAPWVEGATLPAEDDLLKVLREAFPGVRRDEAHWDLCRAPPAER